MHPDVHCNTIYNSQDMEATSMSINRGMDKEDRYIYNGILLSHEKEWNHAICRDVAGTRDCHTEWSKSETERWIMCINASLQNLQKWCRWTYLQSRNRDTDIENQFLNIKERREGAGWIGR